MMTQAIELRKRPHVIIATPGRLVDLMRSNQGEWSLGRVKFLVSQFGVNFLKVESTDLEMLNSRYSMRRIGF